MAETYTPTAVDVTDYTMPEDGDDLDVASIRAALEALADKGRYNRENLLALAESDTVTGTPTFANGFIIAGDVSFSPAQSVTRACDGKGILNTGVPIIVQTLTSAVAPGESAYFTMVGIPDGATITGYGVRINPANDTLPTTNARIVLRQITKAGVASDLDSKTDALTGAAYQAEHDLEKTGVSFTAASTATYVVYLIGEAGGDTDAYDITATPWITYTVTYPLAG